MVHEFKSKVGWFFHLSLFCVAFVCVVTFIQVPKPAVMITCLLLLLVLVFMLVNTWYRITDDGLLICHCGFFPEKRIQISEIDRISYTRMPVSSYALSLDRIAIYKGGRIWLLISPKRQDEFVKLLRSINKDIQIR